ncbi:MAG: peptide deformylase [Dehalococcoidia bacterium]|nr:peptide deformylase [Dehalococcoidia bacterium]
MAVLRIRTVPDPILRRKARRVTSIDTSVLNLIDDMIDTLNSSEHGVGLAATQVGKLLRIAIIQLPDEPVKVLINPEIIKREGERTVDEGCLSIPGYRGQVKRAVTLKVKYRNREGKEERLKCSDLAAQVIEHEIDHLDGILFTDRLVEPGKLEKVEPEESKTAGTVCLAPN